ncbi:MAG: nitrile hydratase subunit beta [Acidimicrobiales bacterium]
MDGPHDLGGRLGFGPVPTAADQPFTARWQLRAQALASVAARVGDINADALRHVLERIPPEEYAALGAGGRWLRAAQMCAEEAGLVPVGELDDRAERLAAGLEPPDPADYPEPVRTTDSLAPSTYHSKRTPQGEPRWRVGDRVRTAAGPTPGHTRLPAYARAKVGEVVLVNGFWVFPDAHAHGRGEAPTWVYAVRFAASQLWPDAGPHAVHLDLFEPYLEPVDG